MQVIYQLLLAFAIPITISVLLWDFLIRLSFIALPHTLPPTNSLSSTQSGQYDNCSQLPVLESVVVRNVHEFEEAAKIAGEIAEPVIFKQYLDNPRSLWEAMAHEYEGHTMTQAVVKVQSFGNVYLAGTRTFVDNVHNITFNDILSADHETVNRYYASFESFLSKESVQSSLGKVPDAFVRDTNFISNFASDVIASPIHSNSMVTSYSVQLMGRKLWIWLSPEDQEAMSFISSKTANFHYQGSEKDMFQYTKKLHVAVVDEGDLLVFPPNWGHAVLTMAGPNVMFNLRELSVLKSFQKHPLRMLETFWSFLWLGWRPHSTAQFNKLQLRMWKEKESYYVNPEWSPPESGCKNVLVDLLRKDLP